MPVTVTTGLFPVAQLPAAQVVEVQIHLTNLENRPAAAQVRVRKLVGNMKQEVLSEEVEIPGEAQRVLSLESDVVEGQTLEVDVTLPEAGFGLGNTGVVPGVAVLSEFTGDGTTSLLQWISASDFVPAPR